MTMPAPLSTLPIRGGGGVLPPLASGLYSLPQVEQILYVDQGSNSSGSATGSRQLPFHSVQAAMVAAAALLPTANNRILIEVMPGRYLEQVLSVTAYVYVSGVSRDQCVIRHAATPLTNTAGNTGFWHLTFEATGAGAMVVNNTAPEDTEVTFWDCRFVGGGVDADAAGFGGDGTHRLVQCSFEHGAFLAFSKAALGTIRLSGCHVQGNMQTPGGNIYLDTTEVQGWLNHLSTGVCSLRDCKVVNAAAFSAIRVFQQTATLILIGNSLTSPAGQYDVSATAILTTLAQVDGNIMTRGMSGTVALARTDLRVGVAGDQDWHATLTDAFASVTIANTTITLLTDVTLTAAITPPSFAIIVNGNGHTILRAGAALFTLGAGDNVTFDHCFLWGEVQVDGAGAVLTLRDSEVLDQIHVVSGDATTLVLITRHSILNGGLVPRDSPLLIDDADPIIVILNSYLKGLLGSPAIYWNAANNNVKIADSTIMHGTLGANNPFGQVGGLAITYADNHSRVNADPSTFPNFTNAIAAGQQYLTIDALADF